MNIPHHILNILMYEAFRQIASKLYLVELRSFPKNLRLLVDQHAICHYQLKGQGRKGFDSISMHQRVLLTTSMVLWNAFKIVMMKSMSDDNDDNYVSCLMIDDWWLIIDDSDCWWLWLLMTVVVVDDDDDDDDDDDCWWWLLMMTVDDDCWWWLLMMTVDDACWWWLLMMTVDDDDDDEDDDDDDNDGDGHGDGDGDDDDDDEQDNDDVNQFNMLPTSHKIKENNTHTETSQPHDPNGWLFTHLQRKGRRWLQPLGPYQTNSNTSIRKVPKP